MLVRNEIYLEALNRINEYPDITLETENGPMPIRQYINNINKPGFFGGELEIAIATGIYHINIATYNEIRNNDNFIGLTPISFYNNNIHDNNNHLMILTNIDNIHFRIGHYNKQTQIDLNYIIDNINNNIEDG